VPAEGGEPRRAIEESATVFSDRPVFTHDGRGIVHVSNRGGATNVWLLPLDGSEPVRLTTGPGPDQMPAVAADGSIAFVNTRWRNTLDVFDLAAGTSRTLLTHSPFLWGPTVAPDGSEIAFSRGEVDGSWQVWTVPTTGGSPRRMTSGEAGGVYPRYSHDGAFIYFHTWGQPRQIGRVPRGGGAVVMLPVAGGAYAHPSRDGTSLVFTKTESNAEQIFVAPLEQPGNARLLTRSPGTVPAWSPDSRQIAFSPDRGYSKGIVIINADGTGERRLTKDGGWPVWFSDGRQIGYLAIGLRGHQEYRVVDVASGVSRTLPVSLRGTNMPFFPMPDASGIVHTNSVHVSDEIWLLKPAERR
jgi:TolB protein